MSQRKLVRHVDLPVSGTFQANVQSRGPVQSSFYHILLRNHVLSNALESETHILVFCCAARFCITFVASHQNEKSKARNMARKNMAPKNLGGEHVARSELVRCHCSDGRLVDGAGFLASH